MHTLIMYYRPHTVNHEIRTIDGYCKPQAGLTQSLKLEDKDDDEYVVQPLKAAQVSLSLSLSRARTHTHTHPHSLSLYREGEIIIASVTTCAM